MNIADPKYGPGLWVCLRLPDGRDVVADGCDPADAAVVAAIRRIHVAEVFERKPAKPADWAAVTAWMDAREPLPSGQLFTAEAVR